MNESILPIDSGIKQKAWNPFFLFWVSLLFSGFAGSLLLADQFQKLGFPDKRKPVILIGRILCVLFLFSALLGADCNLLIILNIAASVLFISWQLPLFSDFKKQKGTTGFWIKPAAKAIIAGLLLVFFLISIQEIRQSLHYRPYEKALSSAQKLHEDGDLSEAEKSLITLTNKYPEEPAAFIELSYIYEDMDILDSALKQAQTALEKTNKAMARDNLLFLNRLRLLNWKRNLRQRIEELPLSIGGQEAIRIWSTGDQEGALAKLRELETKYPLAYQPHAAMSVLFKNKGDNERAIQEAESGLKKIDLKLKSKNMSAQMKTLIDQDRANLRDLIDEIQVLYSRD